jgi:transposase
MPIEASDYGDGTETRTATSAVDSHRRVARSGGHAFYERFNQILEEHHFDAFVEEQCVVFYKSEVMGRPSIAPGVYFRMLMVGYFEGLDSERGIAWRCADSLSLRNFLGYVLTQKTPDHTTVSRTRRLIDIETHERIFSWVLKVLAEKRLIDGKTVGVDATTLEANAAMRSIVRRDTGEDGLANSGRQRLFAHPILHSQDASFELFAN